MLRASVLLFGLLALVGSASAALPDFAGLVERNAAAIVNISTQQRVPVRSRSGDIEDLLRQLRPQPELDAPEQPLEGDEDSDEPPMRQRGGVGSGFVISADGYIVTNHHVIATADLITVTLNDRREYQAHVVGTDELSDLALLKIDADGLNPVLFGDSEALRVGEWVLAIGSPFGLEFSAAVGIVSAKARSVPARGTANYVSFIQTDVAINQGNSGGPLFNLAGEVIGINAQILSSTGGSNGISFAIPSNMALNVIEQLRESGTVNRGLLGVLIKDVDQGLANAFGLETPRGAFVDDVQPDSPAERAGMLANDIVIRMNGVDIEASAQLPFYVGQVRPGREATLTVIRAGEIVEVPVIVGSLPGTDLASVSAPTRPSRGNALALEVSELDRDALPRGVEYGVVIENLRDGPARDAGLASGDVIVVLHHQQVDTVADFERIVDELPTEGHVAIRIVRNGRGTTLAVRVGGQ
jgi:serine protease Do